MTRSYVEVTPNMVGNNGGGAMGTEDNSAEAITDHINWDRYLNLIQGRVSYSAVKFNGQAFNCNDTGHGWDSRSWGSGYWWQNTRQPYYNALAQGDVDTMRSFFDFYLRMLPYVQAWPSRPDP